MKEIRLEGLKQLLLVPSRIVITNHVNPDGDAMGSALGLSAALKALGHNVKVIVPNAYPEFLNWLAGNDEVIIFEQSEQTASELIAQADFIFHLDYNAYSRAGSMQDVLQTAQAKRVLIDHHQQPESWPDFIYSDVAMSSTCQMIYEFLAFNNWLHLLNKDIGECLYTGLITDTGSFRFSSTSSRTLRIAADLMDLGVKPEKIYSKVFDNNSPGRFKLLGTMLDSMIVDEKNKAVILYLSAQDQLKNNYKKGDSEGFVNYGLSIVDTEISVFLREDKDMIKVSLRSKGRIDVNKLSRAKFNGGGHVNAAGGMLTMKLDEAINHAKMAVQEKEQFLQG